MDNLQTNVKTARRQERHECGMPFLCRKRTNNNLRTCVLLLYRAHVNCTCKWVLGPLYIYLYIGAPKPPKTAIYRGPAARGFHRKKDKM